MAAVKRSHDTNTATSVRVRNGQTLVTDGPFAETKEVFGGFYLIDAPNLDEAIKWAAKIPGAVRGTIEVRPVVEFPDTADASQPETAGAAPLAEQPRRRHRARRSRRVRCRRPRLPRGVGSGRRGADPGSR